MKSELGGAVPAVETAKLDEPALRVLYDATLGQFRQGMTQQAVRQPDPAARGLLNLMREVHARAAAVRVSGGVTAVLLLIYGALVTYFIVGLFVVLVLMKATAT